MKMMLRPAFIALVTACFAAPLGAQQAARPPLQTGETARPSDSAASRPSESGAQTNTPSGAATGAGQPQGRAEPPEVQAADSAKAKSQAIGTARTKTSAQSKSARADKKRVHRSTKTKSVARNADGPAAAASSAR
ncbi:MAG: hypothetical protein ACXWCP_03505 [Burkholderiales bacterium]